MGTQSQFGGRYTLIHRLGEGATKEVFLARDETLHRDVALCVFKPHVLSGGYLGRVRREARTLAGLSHPHIVGLYDIREDDGCYLITEYVAGGNLKSKITLDWKDQTDLDTALRIAAEVADALTETHAKGIFHRDIKPNNVLLTQDGTAKLGDFGLAKPLGDESISEEGLIVGTVPYMSPEQAKGLPPDSPSDMYSFGITLFEMVTGRRPFHGEDASVLVHHLNSTPPLPTRYVLSCPLRLEALILQLLGKEPELRPTAIETADELRRIRTELSLGPTPSKIKDPAIAYEIGEGSDSDAISAESDTVIRLGRRSLFQSMTPLVVVLAVGFMAWWKPWTSLDQPVSINQICEIDKQLAYEISTGSAHANDLQSLYRTSPENKSLFDHLERLRELYQDGVAHRGITYIYGAPGVGKSFIVRNHLANTLPEETRCVVNLADIFAGDTEQMGFRVTQRPDVTTLGGEMVLSTLPAIAESNNYNLGRLLSASGCERNGELASLIIVDDLDEIHTDSSRLILRSLDKLILNSSQPEPGFLHVIVVGGSEGFAPWYRDPKRHGGIAKYLSAYELKGPVYSTTGDLEVLAINIFRFQFGQEKWEQKVRSGTAPSLVDQFIRYIRRHRFLTYSIRSLSVATMISIRAIASPDDSEFELKEFLLSELLRRSTSMLGRPDPSDDQYQRILEQIASKYAYQLDDNGFFIVGVNDKISVTKDGQNIGAVNVRDVLDHSGIAITIPGSYSTARYRFEPVWVQAHLIELAN